MIKVTPVMPHFVMPKTFKVEDSTGTLAGYFEKRKVTSGDVRWCFVPVKDWSGGQVFLGDAHEALKKLDAVDTLFGSEKI